MARGWSQLLRSLGESLVEVAGAEAAALKGDLRATGRQVQIVVVLAAATAFLLFWAVGAAGFLLFQGLAVWLPRWGAALVVLGLFLILAGIMALLARQRLRAIELPVDTMRRRYEDHVDWWRSQVLMEEGQSSDRLAEPSGQDRAEPANES